MSCWNVFSEDISEHAQSAFNAFGASLGPTNVVSHCCHIDASSLTTFALNSGVYRVPFAMVPSSPIELEEMRNKNQFISNLKIVPL